ncbi:MAG TPA: M48 family metallopeptidase [Vicinamibacterales bacterium]|nr:M48 family metallopeptidase [Vicinamibacterales bacterium]
MRQLRSVVVTCLTCAVLLVCARGVLHAQAVPPPVPAAAQGPQIDPETATQAYLATMPPDRRARSDAYFEGGYWLQLWGFLISVAIFVALLHSGLSARLRDVAARLSRRTWLQPALYGVAFVLITWAASLPWDIYTGFIREHQYGLATQNFGGWFGDALKELAISGVLTAIVLAIFYAVLRRTGRTWWLWGSLVTIAFLVFVATIGPVYIAPMFNTYTRLGDSPIRTRILSLAHANGIEANDVFEVDASRQSTRVSANVSGMFNTMRITLNDNLLKRASPAAIEAVMGHEMGHYVLNHAYKMLLAFGVIIVVGLGLIARSFDRLAARYRARWRVESVSDPAGLPLIMVLFTIYMFLLTPVVNTIVRTNEYEADLFGLNAARQPDGFAEAALLLSDYRKMSPGPLEEIIFYDHPSGHTRIFTAMRWKAEQANCGAAVPPAASFPGMTAPCGQ